MSNKEVIEETWKAWRYLQLQEAFPGQCIWQVLILLLYLLSSCIAAIDMTLNICVEYLIFKDSNHMKLFAFNREVPYFIGRI